ncbi:hypothetical protein predicted by Glimmer/Critica [Sorangium cellulosum So ce56]|uniref:Uncharacterized protein n=1 Tax=Sorangium cellulosum (strain So ce56) TaxID=448385 RepID=A9GCT6_SORC5|nr:hypothetical protein predicted by Glimmer/Critica [Sorangium cellulosum So ce56]
MSRGITAELRNDPWKYAPDRTRRKRTLHPGDVVPGAGSGDMDVLEPVGGRPRSAEARAMPRAAVAPLRAAVVMEHGQSGH